MSPCTYLWKSSNPHRENLSPLLAALRGGGLASASTVPGGDDGLSLCQRGDAPRVLPVVVREDLCLVAVGPLLKVGPVLVGLGVLDLVVRVD